MKCWQVLTLATCIATTTSACVDPDQTPGEEAEPGGSATHDGSGHAGDSDAGSSSDVGSDAGRPADACAAGPCGSGADTDANEDHDDATMGDDGAISTGRALPCDTSFRYQRVQGCQSNIDGVDVKYFPVRENRVVHGLAVYLHQDEADDWYSNWAFDVIASWALSKDIMIVAPLAPSLYEDGTHGYGAAGTEDTVNAIGPLLTKFKKTYAPTKPTLFWGRSGGSWFMTTWLIPSYGDRLPGLYVPSCGGDVSIPSAWAWDPARAPEARDATFIFFNYGDQDFLAPYIAQAITEYESKGFHTASKVHNGAEHCVHDIDEPTIEFWSQHL